MRKKLYAIILTAVSILSIGIFFTGCENTSDPDVKAYDEWWIRTHNLDGSPR